MTDAAFFIAHPDVIYHAEGNKEKVIYDGRRQGLVEWEGQIQPEIELNDATINCYDFIFG